MPISPENKHLYPKNWKEIRANILARAGNCCEFCGVPNYSHNGPSKVVLTIAHLDHDPTHNDYTNLKALCQKCHNNYDKEHRQANAERTRRDKKQNLDLFDRG